MRENRSNQQCAFEASAIRCWQPRLCPIIQILSRYFSLSVLFRAWTLHRIAVLPCTAVRYPAGFVVNISSNFVRQAQTNTFESVNTLSDNVAQSLAAIGECLTLLRHNKALRQNYTAARR